MEKKRHICPNCNQEVEQGHRVDKCGKDGGRLYRISSNKIYAPKKLDKKKTFERIDTHNGFAFATSGSIVCPVSMAEYIDSIKSIHDATEIKLNQLKKQGYKIY